MVEWLSSIDRSDQVRTNRRAPRIVLGQDRMRGSPANPPGDVLLQVEIVKDPNKVRKAM